MNQEDHTPAEAPTVPEEGFEIDGDENTYKFTAGNFYFQGRLYVSEDVIDNVESEEMTALVEALVAAQHDGETFVPGLLVIVEES
jgi:hypothetical protein